MPYEEDASLRFVIVLDSFGVIGDTKLFKIKRLSYKDKEDIGEEAQCSLRLRRMIALD